MRSRPLRRLICILRSTGDARKCAKLRDLCSLLIASPPPRGHPSCCACPGPLARLLSSFLENLNGDKSWFGLRERKNGMECPEEDALQFFNYDLIIDLWIFFLKWKIAWMTRKTYLENLKCLERLKEKRCKSWVHVEFYWLKGYYRIEFW